MPEIVSNTLIRVCVSELIASWNFQRAQNISWVVSKTFAWYKLIKTSWSELIWRGNQW